MSDNNIPHRKLLDMLAGWSHFIDGDVDINDGSEGITEQEQDAVAQLYQDAGNITADDAEYKEEEPSRERVEKFLLEKVLPFILNGK